MHTLPDEQLLAAWERAYGRPPYERAIVLLATAHPEHSLEEVMHWSIGERDERLLHLRRQIFGNRMETLTRCPACESPLELEFAVEDLLVDGGRSAGQRTIIDRFEIAFRLPHSGDLAALGRLPPTEHKRELLERCVVAVADGEQTIPPSQLPAETVERLLQEMSAADPRANLQIDVGCDACGHNWSVAFDVLSFLWTELSVWAKRLLTEIHALARTYHWSEREILALTPWRRHVYLNMVRQ
jgi:hypothetical protein